MAKSLLLNGNLGYKVMCTVFSLPETIVPFEKTSSVVLSLSIPNVSDIPPVIKIPFSIVVEALRYLEMLKIEKN